MPKSFSIGFAIGAALAPGFMNVFKTAGQKIQGLESTLSKARVGKAISDDLLKYRSAMDGLRAKMQATGVSGANLNQRLFELQKRYDAAAEKAKKYGMDVGDAVRQQRLLETSVKQSERSLAILGARKQNKAVRSEVGGQVVGTVGMVMAAAFPVKQAIEFESAMSDVKKVVNFDTPDGFKQMGGDLVEMSTRIPMVASGLADIMAAAGQSGIARAELLSFTETAAKMGVAFDMSGADSGKMMADWRAGMKLSQDETVALGDAVNHLSNNMNANAAALGGVLQRQGAVAKSAGLTEIQTASLGAALLSSGASEEIAATALKNLTGALTKGTAATKGQKDGLRAIGFNSVKLSKDMQKDAAGTIQKVFKAISSLPKEKQGAIVSEIFGEESRGAIMPLLTNLENLQKAFNLTSEKTKYADSMQKEFEERSKTTANNLTLLRNAATAAGINIGSVFLPPLNLAVGGLSKATVWIATAAKEFPGVTSVVGGVVVGLVSLKVAALAARYGATILSDGFGVAASIFNFFRPSVMAANIALVRQKAIATALWVQTKAMAVGTALWTGAQWLLNAAMTANPIGAIIVGVGLLAAGAYLLIKNWDTVAAFFKSFWEKVKASFSAFTDWLKESSLFTFGAKLMGTFSSGIASQKGEPAAAVGSALTEIDPLMPHSDAKKGPLSRLTASGMSIMDTIGGGIRKAGGSPATAELARAFESLSASAGVKGAPRAGAAPGGSGGIQITFSPTIYISPGTDAAQVRAAANQGMMESESRFKTMMERLMANEQRLSFA